MGYRQMQHRLMEVIWKCHSLLSSWRPRQNRASKAKIPTSTILRCINRNKLIPWCLSEIYLHDYLLRVGENIGCLPPLRWILIIVKYNKTNLKKGHITLWLLWNLFPLSFSKNLTSVYNFVIIREEKERQNNS